jgi:hypothetical protein
MFETKDMLEKLLLPTANREPNAMIFKLSHDNLNMTKTVCRALLGSFSYVYNIEKVSYGLMMTKKFLTIDDSLKRQRCEWLLGVSEPEVKRQYNGTY